MKGVWRRVGWRAGLAVALAAALAGGAAADPAPEENAAAGRAALEVDVTDGLLSLEATAPLAEVLRAIGAAGGFRVVVKGVLAEPVAASFTDQPLEDAIRELVGRRSLVVVRDPSSDPAALAEIKVFGDPVAAAVEEETPAQPAEDAAPDGVSSAIVAHAAPTKDDVLWALDDPERDARVAALPRTRGLPPGEAVEVLSGVLTNEADALVRSRAIAALTRINDGEATALLKAWVRDERDAEIRMQALNALAATVGERATTTFGRALRTDPEPEVRATAIEVLARVGGPWARGYVERTARDLANPVYPAAVEALAAWPEPAEE
jgi:HEAT repeats